MSINNSKFEKTRKTILYVLPIVAVFGLLITLVFGRMNFTLLGSYIAVPMILGPVFYYIKEGNSERNNVVIKSTGNIRIFYICCLIYLISFTISILILMLSKTRNIEYYGAATIMATAILFQIINVGDSSNLVPLVILQMMALVLNIIWGVNLKYYFFIGRTDPIGHAWMLNSLIQEAHISSAIFGIYTPFPLWHILCAMVFRITNIDLSPIRLMFFTGGLVYFFMPLMIFVCSNKFFGDRKLALIAALFTSLNPDVLFYGMTSIPRSTVSFLEVIIIYMLLSKNNAAKTFLLVIITFSTILYHTASMPFILLIFILIMLLQNVYGSPKQERIVLPSYLALAIILSLMYWMYYANDLFKTLIELLIIPAPSGVITKSIINVPLSELFNYLQYSFIFLFVIVGTFYALRSKIFSNYQKVVLLLGFILVWISFPGPTLLINKLAQNIDIDRFDEYSFLFIGMVSAFGFAALYFRLNRYARVVIVLLAAIMFFLSFSNDFIASDNPLIKRPFYTFYLTQDEVSAINTIASISEGYVMSDYVVCRYLYCSNYQKEVHILEVDRGDEDILKSSTEDLILIRNSELQKRPLQLYTSKDKFVLNASWNTLDYYYNDASVWGSLSKYNLVFESNGVTGYN